MTVLEKLRNISRASYSTAVRWAQENGLPMPDYFAHPETYFWPDAEYLKCLGIGRRLNCEPQATWSTEELGIINRHYPQWWYDLPSSDALHMIFDYLKTIELTPYYRALLKFKWETGLLQFPLFAQKDMVETIEGKLAGLIWDQEHGKWEKRLLTDEIVSAEIKRFGGKECTDDKLKHSLARHLLKLHECEDAGPGQFKAIFSWGYVDYAPLLGQMNIRYNKSGWAWYTPPQKPKLSGAGRECTG